MLNRAVAEFICLDEVPIYTVEKSGFRELVRKLNNRSQLSGRIFFMFNEIPKLYTETREAVRSEPKESKYFSCTTDFWTSRAMEVYMAVTFQSISANWEIQAWCLGCSAIKSDHTTEGVREAFDEIIDEWSLEISEMSGLTTNNTSNNIKTLMSLIIPGFCVLGTAWIWPLTKHFALIGSLPPCSGYERPSLLLVDHPR